MTEADNVNQTDDAQEQTDTPSGDAAVVYVGTMDDCKYTMSLLERRQFTCALDVAARLGPKYAVEGYYVVIVPASHEQDARVAIEEELRKDLSIEGLSTDDMTTCPACGATLNDNDEECAECGIALL